MPPRVSQFLRRQLFDCPTEDRTNLKGAVVYLWTAWIRKELTVPRWKCRCRRSPGTNHVFSIKVHAPASSSTSSSLMPCTRAFPSLSDSVPQDGRMLSSTSYTLHSFEDMFLISNFAQPPPADAFLKTVLTLRLVSPVLSCRRVSHSGTGLINVWENGSSSGGHLPSQT